ncbi:cobalamin biosynthesis protein [Candidatus Bathyarchaeota archaeon]|nr:cobalamin biosynthesis protein [Candidatus Bathyarchaeota archaeon]
MINVIGLLITLCVLGLAIIIDRIIGDPPPPPWKALYYKIHPTVGMGTLTNVLKPHFKNSNPKIEKINGVLLALVVIAVFTLPVYFGLKIIFTTLHIIVYVLVAALILKLTICIKLDTDWGKAAAKAIESGDLTEARRYAHFSRRDNKNLTGPLIVSSVIESITENLTDFRLSPIIYYGFFGVPGAVAFRAINTLDGMVGFRDPENINIGWFSAKLDTVVNYIPSRLTAILIVLASAILGEDYKNAWTIARRDQTKVPSLNHGWQMAAIAGALRVQLEKPGHYIIGDPTEELNPNKIIRTLRIRNVSLILCILFMIPIFLLMNNYLFPF